MTKLCPFKKTGCPYASFWYTVTDHFISFLGGNHLISFLMYQIGLQMPHFGLKMPHVDYGMPQDDLQMPQVDLLIPLNNPQVPSNSHQMYQDGL